MTNYIPRPVYLRRLIDRRDNGDVKIITGPRRSGKSWLLRHLYRDYLLTDGVPESNIVMVSFDINDTPLGEDLLNPLALVQHIFSRTSDEAQRYYVFLDEVQMLDDFERIVNGLAARDNIDVYITGSNSRFLSSDIRTIFRGRGDEVRIWPLSFKEFATGRTEPVAELWKEYYTYGGMPALTTRKTPEQKIAYLKRLWQKTYLDDVVERNNIANRTALENIVDQLCSAIGSLTNPNKIRNTLATVQRLKLDHETVAAYLRYVENAFLFEQARRYDVKGRKYYESIRKYYAIDVGLRGARLNFRQQEPTHIMENVIYNELRIRGYEVDVGVVECRTMKDGKSEYTQHEIDFIATNGIDKYYIQSAFALPDDEKMEQELYSLRRTGDGFRKIVIVGADIAGYTNDEGIIFIGLYQFLMSDGIL